MRLSSRLQYNHDRTWRRQTDGWDSVSGLLQVNPRSWFLYVCVQVLYARSQGKYTALGIARIRKYRNTTMLRDYCTKSKAHPDREVSPRPHRSCVTSMAKMNNNPCWRGVLGTFAWGTGETGSL